MHGIQFVATLVNSKFQSCETEKKIKSVDKEFSALHKKKTEFNI